MASQVGEREEKVVQTIGGKVAKRGTRVSSTDLSIRIACGGIAGGIAKTFTAPLERLKMLSQTGEGGGRSALALTRHVIKTEGVSGMFAGNATNLLRIFPSKGVVFASSDYYRKMLRFLAGVPEGTQAPGAVSFAKEM